MDFLTDRFYSFSSRALDADTFAVVSFTGEEGLGKCYRFDIELMTDNAEIDMDDVLRHGATFTIHRNDGDDVQFNGVVSDFEQQHAAGEAVFYRVVLVPRLWRLGLTHQNQVFLDMTVKEIVETVLKDGGLTANDYEFKLQADYAKQRYVCQYGESHLNFVSRRLEREGIYYYFEQGDGSEKIIFTDTAIAHQARAQGSDLAYAPPTGLMDDHHNEVVLGMVCRQKPLPKTVRLKDYNYRKPSLEVAAAATVDASASGEVYLYGEHFDSPREGERLAGIRAQELICGKQRFYGDSTIPYVSPGYTFTLDGHYRKSFNQKYLAVAISHEGSQTGFMMAGLQAALSGREKQIFYRNQFTAIVAGVQFRPPRTVAQPKITGTLNAKIDAAGSGKYAELDEHGRYKVILPFDLSGRKDGKASAWLRMAQPYAGAGHGMHFPLHKGTEVLLTFIEGNPDRPIIAAAVPNTESPSPVTAADQTMAKITTSGGNKIHIEDQEGQQRILCHSPLKNTWLRMGAPNDPPSSGGEEEGGQMFDAEVPETHPFEDGFALSTEGHLQAFVGLNYKFEIGGFGEKLVLGGENVQVIGEESKLVLGGEFSCHFPHKLGYSPTEQKIHELETRINNVRTTLAQDCVAVRERATRLEASVTELQEAKTELQESHTRIAEQVTTLQENRTELSGQVERLSETVTELREECTKISGMETRISENTTHLRENTVAIETTRTQLGELDTKVTNESITLAGSIGQIAGLISQM